MVGVGVVGDADKMGDERGSGDNKAGVDCSGVDKKPGDCGSGGADKMGDERGGGDNTTGVDCSGVEKRPGDCGSEKLLVKKSRRR